MKQQILGAVRCPHLTAAEVSGEGTRHYRLMARETIASRHPTPQNWRQPHINRVTMNGLTLYRDIHLGLDYHRRRVKRVT